MRTLALILILLLEGIASASTITLSYDQAGRLVNANFGGNTNTTFNYDNNGNFLGKSSFVSANPDLSIAQSAAPDPVAVGTLLQYNVTVFNNSTVSATNTVLTNIMPANVTYLSNSVTKGSVVRAGNILSWTVGTLTNTAAAMLKFTIRPNVIGTLTNLAFVRGKPNDPFSSDNTNKLFTTVVSHPAAVAAFDEGNVAIYWPVAGGDGFSVQYSDSLSPPIWQPLSAPITIEAYWFYIEQPLTNQHRFYRLIAP
jgi:uncharacterized repeat protein (TIGR01451 family)